ncbi:sialic acid-binding Ig-like lectin 5 isoform X1 [Dipodomys spectabilis]|uniref:sialic acid-binding Ig-like lectin 5 isoform X1 n=1 Tax=Dipodomys spectabilis TaxID=105255 RepID=UPI001C53E9EA|nr:sialic acid-binding Ig-like lectin 5 isoform X1 [Dipodomys spectabilis]
MGGWTGKGADQCRMGALLWLLLLPLPLLWAGTLQVEQEFNLRVPKLVTVQEGLCVSVPCTFSYPQYKMGASHQLYIYWFKSGYKTEQYPVATNDPNIKVETDTRGRFRLLEHSKSTNCSLHVSDAKRGDRGSYFLHIEGTGNTRYTYRETRLTLEVTALMEKPVIHSPEHLPSGRLAQLTCGLPGHCEGGRPLTFSWTGDVLKSTYPRNIHSPVLTLVPQAEDHNTSLTCQVELQGSRERTERTILLNVSYLPQLLGPSCSWGAEGLHCTCASRAWPAPTLQWRLGEALLVEGSGNNTSVAVTSSSARLWVNSSLSLRQMFSSSLELSCQAQNVRGAQSALILLLPGKPVPRSEAPLALAALGGAGATILLGLCLCLIFFCIVKMYRLCTTGRPQGTKDEDPVMGTVSWGSKQKPSPDNPGGQASPVITDPQELHYASLSFGGMSFQKS